MKPAAFPTRAIRLLIPALILAAGVFGYRAMHPATDRDQEALIRVAVGFTLPAGDLIVSSASTRTVDIRVTGKPKHLEGPASASITLNLDTAVEGDNRIAVSPDQVVLPPGIRAHEAIPPEIVVTLDRKITRTLTVDIPFSGAPAKGYRLAGILALPPSVTVTGPAGLVDGLDRLRTKPVDIGGLTESCKKEAVFDQDSPETQILPPGPVTALISIADIMAVKIIDVPLTLPGPWATAHPARATLEISGPENRFKSLDINADIRLSIDTEDLKPGVYVRRAAIRLPVDFTLISVKPELFTLTINEKG
ncbi:hypothetical protein JCM14469_27370 [Desulfatiferula olefinivorans]